MSNPVSLNCLVRHLPGDFVQGYELRDATVTAKCSYCGGKKQLIRPGSKIKVTCGACRGIGLQRIHVKKPFKVDGVVSRVMINRKGHLSGPLDISYTLCASTRHRQQRYVNQDHLVPRDQWYKRKSALMSEYEIAAHNKRAQAEPPKALDKRNVYW